jgi:hypothetical protein
MDVTFVSTRDLILYALPLAILFAATALRLDELVTSRKKTPTPGQHLHPMRTAMFSDPDGRPWRLI